MKLISEERNRRSLSRSLCKDSYCEYNNWRFGIYNEKRYLTKMMPSIILIKEPMDKEI